MYWNFSLSLSHSGVFRCVSHSWDFTAHIHINLMLIWIKSDSEVMWIYEHFIFKTLLFDWLSCERHPGPVKTDGAPFWSPNWRHTVELSQQLQCSTASLDNLCKLHSWSYTFIDKTKYRTIRNVWFPPCLDHLLSFYWSVIVNEDVRNKTAADCLYVTYDWSTSSCMDLDQSSTGRSPDLMPSDLSWLSSSWRSSSSTVGPRWGDGLSGPHWVYRGPVIKAGLCETRAGSDWRANMEPGLQVPPRIRRGR